MSNEAKTNEPTVEGTDNAEPKVKINRERYTATKTASGAKSLNNGDEVATVLDGLHVDELFKIGSDVLGEDFSERYAKLNVGMQRMNMGNRLRAKARTIDADNEKAKLAAEKDGKPFKEKSSGLDVLTKAAKPFAKERDARNAAAAKEKEAKQKEREAKAAEKVKKDEAKVEAKAKADKEASKPTTAK